MDATLRELCKRHELTAVSILYQGEHFDRTTVYLHWNEAGEGVCVSGGGETCDAGLAVAVAEMSHRRDRAAREHAEGVDVSGDAPALVGEAAA